ncbi:hypothetical protein [Methanogenium cariaci]|uniref:hypothetical protein n=1 Tax=Methanogenium cariaci TaxID=2197 RepID=UPI001C472403|nr:hypothetical protein [Methanogenium cariaci]
MSLNPVVVTEEINKRYLGGYLRTTFHIDDPEIASLFQERLETKEFIKGPILEITPPPIKQAHHWRTSFVKVWYPRIFMT